MTNTSAPPKAPAAISMADEEGVKRILVDT